VQVLPILFGAFFTVAVCVACGRSLLRETAGWGMAFVIGAAALSLAVFLFCAAGVAYPAVFLTLGLVLLLVAGRSQAWFRKSKSSARRPIYWALLFLFALFAVVYLCYAMAPEASPDGSAYHLGLVSRYLREHGFHRITTSIYANLSQGVEMLFLFAFAFGKHSAAAMVHLAFLFALAWQMFAYSRSAGFPVAGACAAFLVFASPVVGIDASSAYNDVAVAAIAFTLFHLLQIWEQQRTTRLLVAIGLAAGFAYAAKYTAAVAAPYAIGYVAWKSRKLRQAALVAGCAALLIVPWMSKDWLWAQNPVSPFFNRWFPNPYVTTAFERQYTTYLRHYDLASLWQIPWQVTTRGGLFGVLGPVFWLTPLALLAVFRREGRRLLVAALVFGAPYFSNIGTRFLIPPLPFLALALAMVICAVSIPACFALVLVHAVLSWPSIVPKYGREDAWRFQGIPWREALRLRNTDAYLERRLPKYPVARMIESLTAPGATIFTIDPPPEAYTSRRILVEYESAENEVTGRILLAGAAPEYAPTLRLRFPFPRQRLQAIRVVQTNTGGERWTIHELRVFDGSRELPRQAPWRLRARPFPWGVQDAFDNSPITFWISGDTLQPGMFVEVNFGAAQEADSVQIETSPNQWQARLHLEGRDVSGQWKILCSAPQQSEEMRPPGLRAAVAAELKRRGIDYLLLSDGDRAAGDLRRNTGQWGVRAVGEYRGDRLYQLP
jgi:hypothetical protein